MIKEKIKNVLLSIKEDPSWLSLVVSIISFCVAFTVLIAVLIIKLHS